MESLPVAVIYKVISSVFCVIERGWFAVALTGDFLLRVSCMFFGENNVPFRMHLQHYLIFRPVKRELMQI